MSEPEERPNFSLDLPIVIIPDKRWLSEEGFLFADKATVIADKICYERIRRLLKEQYGVDENRSQPIEPDDLSDEGGGDIEGAPEASGV